MKLSRLNFEKFTPVNSEVHITRMRNQKLSFIFTIFFRQRYDLRDDRNIACLTRCKSCAVSVKERH